MCIYIYIHTYICSTCRSLPSRRCRQPEPRNHNITTTNNNDNNDDNNNSGYDNSSNNDNDND